MYFKKGNVLREEGNGQDAQGSEEARKGSSGEVIPLIWTASRGQDRGWDVESCHWAESQETSDTVYSCLGSE